MLDHRAAEGDWASALATVESNAAAKLIDKPTANRWRAVLKTAIAQDRALREPQAALILAHEALRLAPDLAPAAVLAGRLTAAHGDYRRASKIIETSYARTSHPDLAAVYLRMRPGDSAGDRLARARALARVAPNEPESRLTVARAALEARDFAAAREAMAPLLSAESSRGRPSVRACLLMADLEETEGGAPGAVREWLARAARAPRDPAWIADDVVSDTWAPASPSGKLDAFVWRVPNERLTAPSESLLPAPEPEPAALAPTIEAPASEPSLVAQPEPTPTSAFAPSETAASHSTEEALDAPLPTPGPPDDPGAHAQPKRRFGLFSS
jgi:HemY protein